jgi:aspartokinase
MTQEELTKLLMESYKRGQSDLIKSCHETISIAVHTAILAEREACAKLCDVLAVHPEYASDVTKLAALAIRARGQA